MKAIYWNDEKNQWLKLNRGIGFEEIVEALDDDRMLEDLPNPSKNFPLQRVFVVDIDGYAIVVPYIRDGDSIFLKTLFADRKATRKYLKGSN
jgi:hypothetical protein